MVRTNNDNKLEIAVDGDAMKRPRDSEREMEGIELDGGGQMRQERNKDVEREMERQRKAK